MACLQHGSGAHNAGVGGGAGHGQKAQFTPALTEPPPARNSRDIWRDTLGKSQGLKHNTRESRYPPKDEQVLLHPEAFSSEVASGFVIEAPGPCGPFIRVAV